MVDQFINLVYVYLMISTGQEEKLVVKLAFECRSAIFGVRIKRCYAYNGWFSQQPFQEVVEEPNQTIKFCGIGFHHQNSITKWKIQTLILGARTALLHANSYWSEAITTILWPYYLKASSKKLNYI